MSTNIGNPAVVKLLLAVLVKRLGGEVTISQADIDAVAYGRLLEGEDQTGACIIKLEELNQQAA